jgi:SAM-dependent methyltransferase
MGRSEHAGLAEMRAQLLLGARGRTLELGAGTGLNLRHYPRDRIVLTLTEPEASMTERLERRVAASRPDANVVQAAADRLPFEDSSFDSVISTLVLCTVRDQAQALAEVRRVLAPDGALLFLEHVRSDDPALRAGRIASTRCGCGSVTAATATATRSPACTPRASGSRMSSTRVCPRPRRSCDPSSWATLNWTDACLRTAGSTSAQVDNKRQTPRLLRTRRRTQLRSVMDARGQRPPTPVRVRLAPSRDPVVEPLPHVRGFRRDGRHPTARADGVLALWC